MRRGFEVVFVFFCALAGHALAAAVAPMRARKHRLFNFSCITSVYDHGRGVVFNVGTSNLWVVGREIRFCLYGHLNVLCADH